MTAYYNENDRNAAAWLRELIKAGLIADGQVDERSITEVEPGDVRGFTQCHWFAGIGVWSYALRNAGWSDDTPVWTGSCPCQGFSASGKRGGFSDKRHLWPAWFRLIRECRPDVCFGEQVASKDGLAWFDVVSSDLEGEGYTVGAADTPACGYGAPHIRQRLYFVADSQFGRRHDGGWASGRRAAEPVGSYEGERGNLRKEVEGFRDAVGLADSGGRRREQRNEGQRRVQQPDPNSDVGHPNSARSQRQSELIDSSGSELPAGTPSLTNGFWADAEWLWCKDGKYRPAKPGIFPLASGAAGRVGLLRGAGNALCAPQAEAFIEAYMEIKR